MSDQLVAKASTYKTQHTNTTTKILDLSGIRTHCISVQAIKDYAIHRAATLGPAQRWCSTNQQTERKE
jgi:hypothetical protein